MDMDKKINEMNYSEFVGFIKEQNRPSGGIKTIHNVAVNGLINSTVHMLEIGSNTGFTSVNMSLLTGCSVVGIDVNDESLTESNKYAARHNVQDKITFIKADTITLPFEDESFDVVWCSNVTSFITDKEEAVAEYLRVLKTGGTLVVVPIYYWKQPPKKIVEEVSEAIAADINIQDKQSWKDLFSKVAKNNTCHLELYYEDNNEYLDVQDRITGYVDMLMKKNPLDMYTEDEQEIIKNRAKYFYKLFNENLQYANYSTLLYQKRALEDEIELFVSRKI
jgi:ubiquinone/menaquinone biosynthesis C-methylase UbiE